MQDPSKKSSTQTRLLDAATVVFAKKGFTDATVAEICEQAEANISAINYHFGSKEELYRASWMHAFSQAVPSHDEEMDDPAASPETHLHFQISLLIERIANPDNHVFAIMEHEFANPTGLLRDIITDALLPHKARFNAPIAALLGNRATDEAIDLCRASIIAQCFHLNKLQKLNRTHGELANFDHLDARSYAEHVYRFSLGGIGAVRKGLEA